MSLFLGMVQMGAFGVEPAGWAWCDGQLLPIPSYAALYAVLGTTFGGDGIANFGLPQLRFSAVNGAGSGSGLTTYAIGDISGEETHTLTTGEMATHDHDMIGSSLGPSGCAGVPTARVPAIASASLYALTSDSTNVCAGTISEIGGLNGVTQPHTNLPPQFGLAFMISWDDTSADSNDPDYEIGEMRMLPYAAPTNWLNCDGAAVSRTTYADLFAVIGTTYGPGNGTTTFNLPNMCGRVPVHIGPASPFTVPSLSAYTLGQSGGVETVALSTSQIPTHRHFVGVAAGRGGRGSAGGVSSGQTICGGVNGVDSIFALPGSPVTMDADAVRANGSGTGHNNLAPQVAFQYAIAYAQ